ncbi:MAG TPA: hypothetical protein VHY91_02145 [Pirellulales bacterium]|jgi:hypothetical protein|nr:hypothetical protein [Pirellulales bacterium]
MKGREQPRTDIIPISAGCGGKAVQYSYDGRTLVCSPTRRSRAATSLSMAAFAAGCSFGLFHLARNYSGHGLSGGEWFAAVIALPAAILFGIYVMLWVTLTDAKAVFDFSAGQLSIEHKVLRSLRSTVVPLKEIAAVRAGAAVTPPRMGAYGTGYKTFFLSLALRDGAELRLFETTDERVVNATRDIIQKHLGLAVA